MVKITVSGIVQGVGFRYFAYRTAHKLALNGYVKNKNDGSVEIVAEGDKNKLLKLIEELRIGPPGSAIDSFRINWEDSKNDLNEFRILR
jgi:acylphosphatase